MLICADDAAIARGLGEDVGTLRRERAALLARARRKMIAAGVPRVPATDEGMLAWLLFHGLEGADAVMIGAEADFPDLAGGEG